MASRGFRIRGRKVPDPSSGQRRMYGRAPRSRLAVGNRGDVAVANLDLREVDSRVALADPSIMTRMLPTLTPGTEFFWTAGATGRLRILRCGDCATYVHPPSPICPCCLSRRVAPEPVSGRGRVHSFTVNHQRWRPDLAEPYVIAIVELEEQLGLRLLTNVVGCAPEEVAIGMEVEVRFEVHGDVYLPLFTPTTR